MAKKKLNSVIGVDIGSQSIKIAEIKVSGREISISALGMVPTPTGLVDHTGVYDTDTLGPLIKQVCTEAGATAPNVVFSIAGQASILVRTTEVGKMSPGELSSHMEWEISRNIPFAESTVVSDFKAFPQLDPASQNMDVVMAISPQSAVDTLVGIGKKAGKAIHALDVEPLGLARVLKAGPEQEFGNETVCVIEIGHKSTAINMYRDGQLLMPRQVLAGGEAFTTAIVNALNVSLEDAERMKSEVVIPEISAGASANPFAVPGTTQSMDAYNPFVEDFAIPAPVTNDPAPSSVYDYSAPVGSVDDNPFAEPTEPVYTAPVDQTSGMPDSYASPFADDEPAAPPAPDFGAPPAAYAPEPIATPVAANSPAFDAISMEVDEFVGEIRRSVDYFRSRGGDINRIVLAGGGAKLGGLSSLLERTLGVPTQLLDPTKGFQITAKRLDFGMLETHRPTFAVAIGNALHIAFD